MTSLYAAPIHTAIQPSAVCCKRSLNTIRSLLLALRAGPERQRSRPIRGPLFYNLAKRWLLFSKQNNASEHNLKHTYNCLSVSVCVLGCLICVFMWARSCVGVCVCVMHGPVEKSDCFIPAM